MLVKPSSSTNDSLSPLNSSSFTSPLLLNMFCFLSPQSDFIFAGFFITNSFVLFFLSVSVLYHAARERKQKGSFSSLMSTISHSDFFTYNLVVMEITGMFGCVVCFCAICSDQPYLLVCGAFPWFYAWYGETLFHTLTCLERYLAVVHPVTYMRLRNEQGIIIRNISTGCVWLLSLSGVGLMWENVFIGLNFCILAAVLIIVSFCSLSALLVLIRPGPGKQQRSKQRAFYTIVAILGVLVLRFLASLVWTLVYALQLSSECVILGSMVWLTMPSSLVLPLLFLHRAEKLLCCK